MKEANIKKPLLIVGVGNPLMGDEGIGTHAVRFLKNENTLPPDVDIVDEGMGGFKLLQYFEAYSTIIIIDAAPFEDEVKEGKIRILYPRIPGNFRDCLQQQDEATRQLLSALQIVNNMPEIYLVTVGISPVQQQSTSLSAAMLEVLPKIQDTIHLLCNRVLDPQLS